ncbi:MAG: helix-turn-helix transcriptional regulator [Burkholderiaceae bacterium]
MKSLLNQLKQRRKELGLTQAEMHLRTGMSRQQYQRLESRGNPRLDSLELLAKGLRLELMLVPQEKLRAVQAVLNDRSESSALPMPGQPPDPDDESPVNDPWKNLLKDDE